MLLVDLVTGQASCGHADICCLHLYLRKSRFLLTPLESSGPFNGLFSTWDLQVLWTTLRPVCNSHVLPAWVMTWSSHIGFNFPSQGYSGNSGHLAYLWMPGKTLASLKLPFSLPKEAEALLRGRYLVRFPFPESQTETGSEASLLLSIFPSIDLSATLGQVGHTSLTNCFSYSHLSLPSTVLSQGSGGRGAQLFSPTSSW